MGGMYNDYHVSVITRCFASDLFFFLCYCTLILSAVHIASVFILLGSFIWQSCIFSAAE